MNIAAGSSVDGKGKGKGKEESVGENDDEEYVFVKSEYEERKEEKTREEGRERKKEVKDKRREYTTAPASSSGANPQASLAQPQPILPSRPQGQVETRNPVPSHQYPQKQESKVLGLVLVPSPDKSGYEYQYRYMSVPPVQDAQINVQGTTQPSYAYMTDSRSSTAASNATSGTGTIRAESRANGYTQSQPQAYSRAQTEPRTQTHNYNLGQQQATSTALHFPQPRRVSLTIPEPSPDPSPSPVGPHAGYTSNIATNAPYILDATDVRNIPVPPVSIHVNGPVAVVYENSSAIPQSQAYPSTVRDENHALKHKASDTSTISSASTTSTRSTGTGRSISLSGTKGERRKQLLDALFTETTSQKTNGPATAPAVPAPGLGNSAGVGGMPIPTVSDSSTISGVSLGYALDHPGATSIASTSKVPTAYGKAVSSSSRSGKSMTDVETTAPTVRGVPSRDGRPSRGLSSGVGTRPGTTVPGSIPGGTYAHPTQAQTYTQVGYIQAPPYQMYAYPTVPPSYSYSTATVRGGGNNDNASSLDVGAGSGYQPQPLPRPPSFTNFDFSSLNAGPYDSYARNGVTRK